MPQIPGSRIRVCSSIRSNNEPGQPTKYPAVYFQPPGSMLEPLHLGFLNCENVPAKLGAIPSTIFFLFNIPCIWFVIFIGVWRAVQHFLKWISNPNPNKWGRLFDFGSRPSWRNTCSYLQKKLLSFWTEFTWMISHISGTRGCSVNIHSSYLSHFWIDKRKSDYGLRLFHSKGIL